MKIGMMVAALCMFAYIPVPALARVLTQTVSHEGVLNAQGSANSFVEQGIEQLAEGNFQAAIESANRAIEIDSQVGEAYAVRARAQDSLGRPDEAIRDYGEALNRIPNGDNKAQAFYNRAIVYSDRKDFSAAITDLTSALGVIANNSELKADIYYKRGFFRSENNQALEAIEDFTKTLELDSNYLEAYAQRGLTIIGYLGDPVAGTRDLIAATRLTPKDRADAYWNRGVAYSALGNLQAADADFDSSLQIDPNYLRSLVDKGSLAIDALDVSGFETAFQRVLDINADDWAAAVSVSNKVAYFAETILASNSSTQELRDAAATFYQPAFDLMGRTISQNPYKPFPYIARGTIFLSLAQPTDALKDFSQALSLEPNYAGAYYLRGVAHAQQRNLTGAIADFDRAIQASPNFADAYLYRGSVRLDLGDSAGQSDVAEALRIYNEVIQLNSNGPMGYLSLGHAKALSGDEVGAMAAYQESARLSQQQDNLLLAQGIANTISAREQMNVAAPLIEDFDTLTVGGPTLDDNSLYASYSFEGRREQKVVVILSSNEFDPTVTLLDPKGEVVASNDDVTQGFSDSYVSVTLPVDGTYTVVANAYDQTGAGTYSLIVVPIPTDGLNLQNSGTLNAGELALTDGSAYDRYYFEGRQGQSVSIDMASADFDAYLVLLDSEQNQIAQNDDISASNSNARITTVLPSDGIYMIWANGYDANALGQYSITAR